MRKFLLLITLFIGFNSFGQVQWMNNFELAQAKATAEGKFIVMDFWAIWCGPCKVMDRKMWNEESMNAYNDKFVFLKVDVDSNPTLAMKYSARTIPMVVIVDALGNSIWERTGFSNESPYMEAFKSFPSDRMPAEQLKKVAEDDDNALYALGQWYQESGKSIENPTVSRAFITESDSYFKQIRKSDNELMAKEAEFNLILNQAYRGATAKAMKKVQKMEENDMKNFILAYCYKCEGQTEKMKEFVAKIESEELAARLD
ncbi:thioredoxin family protein [Ekhidna sp.]|uniref:thioredoxin family protein n=1 Tax=Ekhidna sp. TaxID=2608089 RepID=UPI003B511A07